MSGERYGNFRIRRLREAEPKKVAEGVGGRQSGGLSDEDSNDGRSGCTSTDACTERGGFRSEALGPIDGYEFCESPGFLRQQGPF